MSTVNSMSQTSALRLMMLEQVDGHQKIDAPAHYVAGRKHDEVKDLNKGIWYLQRRIQQLNSQQ